uniref:CW-type zinc finger protein n=1 Tax=Phaseolus vulgaris TaxID=3885 RepID=E9NZV0_PHAVU|nr:CW-type zinc finger protein [Phaseolus vulgaris]
MDRRGSGTLIGTEGSQCGGGRDAIKGLGLGLGLGLGAGRREMMESELEEGEACSFQNHEDYDATVDPDVALSYIKDFEGGVSAENLGAKFGGYGSFLPTYQRSPGGQGDAVQCSTGTQSSRLGTGSGNSSGIAANKDDSPSESEGISRGPQEAPFESPTIILQIMTDLPQLLSPLSEGIIELTIKEMRARDSIPGLVHLDDAESFDISLNESNNVKGDRKFSGGSGRKMKSLEGCESSMEVKGSTKKNAQIETGVLSRKEQSTDASTMEELVSNTMKLPLLSSSYSFSDDLVRVDDGPCDSLKEAHKVTEREKTFSVQGQKEWPEPTSTEVNGFAERGKGSSRRKVMGDKVPFDDYIVKENSHGDYNCHSIIAESNVSKVRTTSNTEEPPKKANQRGSLCEQDSMALPVVTEHPFLVAKKKTKGSHDTMTEDVRVQKSLGKTRDTYRDFFGELEDEEDKMDALETPFEEKLKESQLVGRSAPTTSRGAKERPGAKKVDKLLTDEMYSKTASNIWCTGNANGTAVENGKGIPVMIPPVESDDNWVMCESCHQWRLLPVGTNPDHLPEKWLCSMLNWLSWIHFKFSKQGLILASLSIGTNPDLLRLGCGLDFWRPDMNRCSFSEDETTKALIALYQAPPFDGQSSLQNVSGSVMVGGAMATSQHPDQQQLNNDVHAVPRGKKKFVKEIPNPINKDNFSQSSYPFKKNVLSAVKSRSLNDVNKSPVMSEADVPTEKHKNKRRTLERSSDIGDTKNMKVKSRRDHDEDFSRPSKKSKSHKAHSTNEEWTVEQSGTTRKVGVQSSNSTFPTTSVGKDRPRQKAHSSSRDSKSRKDKIPVSAENTKDKGHGSLDEGSLDLGNCDSIGSVKKRKLKGYQDAITYSPGNPRIQESKTSEHDFSDSRKEKKAKSSKSGGKESSTSKGSGRTDKKDLGSLQVSVAATSSSSKVSGSHKTKASFQEAKGSPVESVSSSPIRISNADKFSNKEITGKDDSHEIAVVDSPRRCSNRDNDGGIDRSGTARKEKSLTVANRPDFQDKGVNYMSDTKIKAETIGYCTNGGVDTIIPDGTYAGKEQIKHPGEDKTDVSYANMSHTRKNGMESGFEDNNDGCKSESHVDKVKVKNASSSSQLKNQSPLGEAKHKDGKNKLQEKFGIKPDQSENIHPVKKDYTEKNETRKKENHLIRGHDFQDVSMDALCKQDAFQAPSQTQLPDSDRSTKKSLLERTDQELVYLKEMEMSKLVLPKSMMRQSCQKAIEKTDHQNGNQQTGSRNPILNGHKSKELDAPSPVRRDSYSHAANNAVKEAKDLKHLADRLKNSGSGESTSLYFQAALKFLHGASLLESGNSDNAKHSEMIQSKQMYSSTAKLCEFCAHEYEKSKDMASAALAYKCMEVAYMRVVYSSHTSASRDRHELHNTLQMIPLGESPSSSASDVDNVNNSTAADKVVTISKSVNSPQVAGNHVIAARHRPNFVRLLGFAQDVNFAMEASRKSRNAFAAANSSPGVGKNTDGISSIKKALDFSFQDVEGLLRLSEVMKGKVYLLDLDSILPTGEANSEMEVSIYSQEFGCALLFTSIKSLQSLKQCGGPSLEARFCNADSELYIDMWNDATSRL